MTQKTMTKVGSGLEVGDTIVFEDGERTITSVWTAVDSPNYLRVSFGEDANNPLYVHARGGYIVTAPAPEPYPVGTVVLWMGSPDDPVMKTGTGWYNSDLHHCDWITDELIHDGEHIIAYQPSTPQQ